MKSVLKSHWIRLQGKANTFGFVWISWWVFKLLDLLNDLSQSWHLNGCSLKCINWWICEYSLFAKRWSQNSQLYGFSPVCHILWFSSFLVCLRSLLHIKQIKFFFLVLLPLTISEEYFLSWICMWYFKLGNEQYDLLQSWQLKGFVSSCVNICFWRFVFTAKQRPHFKHLYGFSPVCNNWWFRRFWFIAK